MLEPPSNCQTVVYFIYKSVLNEKEYNRQPNGGHLGGDHLRRGGVIAPTNTLEDNGLLF